MAKKSNPKPEPQPMIFNKPGGEGTVIIRSGCPGCGLVNGHTPTCPKK